MRALAFIAIATTAFAATDSILPKPFAQQRYETTRTNSPFVLASIAPPQVTAVKTKFSEAMYVTGLGRAGGSEFVTIVKVGDESRPIRLSGNTPNEDGIAVHRIEWSDEFGKSKVQLTKDGEVEEIGFNENAAKSAPPPKPTKSNKPPTSPPPAKQPVRIRIAN